MNQQRRLLFIGLDGLRGDCAQHECAPNLQALAKQGLLHMAMQAGNYGQTTMSDPGWSSLLTGVWAPKHRVFDAGDFAKHNYRHYPHFFQHLKAHNSSLITASIVHWQPINTWIAHEAITDYREHYPSDLAVVDRAVALLGQEQAPHALYLHLDDVDAAGHLWGFEPDSKGYLRALAHCDELIGALAMALSARSEEWLIIIASDHGGKGRGRGHGGQSPAERSAFALLTGNLSRPYGQGLLQEPLSLVDLVPTMLEFLGIPLDAAWELDGQAIQPKSI